ncbi:MAG: redoxin domain-containing protein [Pirellulaceae bacterium]
MRRPGLLCVLLLTFGLTSLPQARAADVVAKSREEGDQQDPPETLAGHSYHGEFLNEGPRQSAYLMAGTGAVKFPVTTKSSEAQAFVEQGIGQLYGFWYLEAERSFRQAAMLDPQCAMAFWGAALATKKVERRAKGFIAEAVQRKEEVSKRERMYIEALDAYLNFADRKDQDEADDADKADDSDDEADKKGAKDKKLSDEDKEKQAKDYTEALEAIALEFPEDIEAKAFLALQLYENKGELPNPSVLAVDGLMDKVFAAEPMHPAHHFRIHLWDYKKPEVALQSAALCGPSAPAIAHMWHMPGHIYSRLKRYDDAVWQQEASARVDHAHMIRDRVLPDQIHNFAHNNEWLIRNLNHIGRVDDAVALAKNMISLPRHPKYNTLEKQGSLKYGRLRLIETLTRYELWQQAIDACQSDLLPPTDEPKEQLARLRLLGVAAVMTDRREIADETLVELNDRLKKKRDEQKAAGEKAAEKIENSKANDETAGERDQPDDAEADKQSSEEKGDQPDADQRKESEALKKKIEKARADARKPFATPINDLVKAIAEIETFQKVKAEDFPAALNLAKKAGRNISPFQSAYIQLRCGDPKKAIAAAKKEVDKNKNEVQPLAWLAFLYEQSGQWSQAKETFEKLRTISASIDLDSIVFQRLQPIAQDLGLPADWRCEAKLADDLGERPELDALGPFRWHPSPAPKFELFDAEGNLRSLEEFRGRPMIAIFYLGFGCLHCAEQLQAFAPAAAEYAEAGIEIVAISSDNREDLKKSIHLYDGQPLPFPLLSNADLQTFKAYRAYDDFESQPLHGTFLIDSKGLVRWQDTGFEPFMDAQFLLEESRRLLGIE